MVITSIYIYIDVDVDVFVYVYSISINIFTVSVICFWLYAHTPSDYKNNPEQSAFDAIVVTKPSSVHTRILTCLCLGPKWRPGLSSETRWGRPAAGGLPYLRGSRIEPTRRLQKHECSS